jgi:hypothetical protein
MSEIEQEHEPNAERPLHEVEIYASHDGFVCRVGSSRGSGTIADFVPYRVLVRNSREGCYVGREVTFRLDDEAFTTLEPGQSATITKSTGDDQCLEIYFDECWLPQDATSPVEQRAAVPAEPPEPPEPPKAPRVTLTLTTKGDH